MPNNTAKSIQASWKNDARWSGIDRPYTAEDVLRLRGSVLIEQTLAEMGAKRLWELMGMQNYVHALGAVTGNQAVQMVQAGLQAIYVSGWQVAGDANSAGQTYPDQSLYPADSAPNLVKRINNALLRADQIQNMHGDRDIYWMAPILADAESGFGGALNSFELMKAMIAAGAAAVHFEDQLSSAKKCGHMGGKVIVPASVFIKKLVSARLAADLMGVPTILVARTDAQSAKLLESDLDVEDRKHITSGRTAEGFYTISGGLEMAIERGLQYAPYADVLWCETSKPDIGEAREFAEEIHRYFPNKLLTYNCSPSFNWRKHLDQKEIQSFQNDLGELGYKFQFVTLAGFHSLNLGMFELAVNYSESGMAAYSNLQEREFKMQETAGFAAIKHQSFVGAGYFDEVQKVISQGETSIVALQGSTEQAQFQNS